MKASEKEAPEENKGRQLQQNQSTAVAAVIGRRPHYLVNCATLKPAVLRPEIFAWKYIRDGEVHTKLLTLTAAHLCFTLTSSCLLLHNWKTSGEGGAELARQLLSLSFVKGSPYEKMCTGTLMRLHERRSSEMSPAAFQLRLELKKKKVQLLLKNVVFFCSRELRVSRGWMLNTCASQFAPWWNLRNTALA